MDQDSKGIVRIGSNDEHENKAGKKLLKPHFEEDVRGLDQGPNEAMFEEFDSRNFAKDGNYLLPNYTYFPGNPNPQETPQKIPRFSASKSSFQGNQNGGNQPSKEAHYFHTEEEDEMSKKQLGTRKSYAEDFIAFDTKEKIFQFQEEGFFCFANDTHQNLENIERTEEYKTYHAPRMSRAHVKHEHSNENRNSIKFEHITQPLAIDNVKDDGESHAKPPLIPMKQEAPRFIPPTNLPSNYPNTGVTGISPQETYQQLSHQQRLHYLHPNPYGYFPPQMMHPNFPMGFPRGLLMNLHPQLMASRSQIHFTQNKLPNLQMNVQSNPCKSDVMSLKQKVETLNPKPMPDSEEFKASLNTPLLNNLPPMTQGKFVPLKDCNLDLFDFAKKFTQETPKKRPGKNPFQQPKDVGRHFLKVHMKKAIAYTLQNSDKVSEAVNDYFFKHNQNRWGFSERHRQEFLTSKAKAFIDWVHHLRAIFKDYGKEDFKTAYCVNSTVLRERIKNTQRDERDERDERSSMKELFEHRDWDTQVTFKEVFRSITLDFIRNTEKGGLIHELLNANNILTGAQHIRYVYLSEWLVEQPSRIDGSEIFGKRWVESFFKANNLLPTEV